MKNDSNGKLIALDGSGGKGMVAAAEQIERALAKPKTMVGISSWDASGIFFQMSQAAAGLPTPSARALLLLYASDLAFRLRWHIRPAMEEGQTVIAAAYLETAFAFGKSCGISGDWLKEVFSFAPAASASYRMAEKKTQRGTPSDSFLEFCLAQFRGSPLLWNSDEIRANFEAHLDHLEAKGKCIKVTKGLRKAAAV